MMQRQVRGVTGGFTRRLPKAVRASALVWGLLGLACQLTPKTMNEEEFCLAYASRECGKVAFACSFEKPTECERVRGNACRDWVKKTKTEVRGFRPDNVDGCLDKVTEVYGQALIKPEHWKALSDACQRVFQGSHMANEMCAIDQD